MAVAGNRRGLSLLIQIWAVFAHIHHSYSTGCTGAQGCQPAPTAFPKLPPAIHQFPLPMIADDVNRSGHHVDPPKCCGAPPTVLPSPKSRQSLNLLQSPSHSTTLLPLSTPPILSSPDSTKQRTTTTTTDATYLSTPRTLKCRETAQPAPDILCRPREAGCAANVPVCPYTAAQPADILRTAPRVLSSESSPTAPVQDNDTKSQPQEAPTLSIEYTTVSETVVLTSWVTNTAHATDTQTHVERMTSYTTVHVTQSMTCYYH